MASPPHLSLILPAYNEAATIRRTLRLTRAYLDRQPYPYEILVAADGDDGTRELARAEAGGDPRLRVLGDPGRHGKGRGIRLAVAQARGAVLGFADADYKTPIEELEKLLPWLRRGYDLVIGSRAGPGSHIEAAAPLHRRLGSRVFALGMHLLVGLWDISDTQCGFKFFRGEAARDLFGRQRVDGYMFDVEVLYLARLRGYKVKEVGVRWRGDGDTRLNLVSGNWRNFLDLLRIRFGDYRAAGAGRLARAGEPDGRLSDPRPRRVGREGKAPLPSPPYPGERGWG
jgi:dolichyl-phosphate beta-glucosyltransferase